MKKNRIDKIFELFQAQNPDPKTELEYCNNYTLLIAVILSAQSTDKGVNKATKLLFQSYSSPQQIINLGLEGLIGYIKTIGLYNSKAKNIIALSKILVNQYQGDIPNNMEDLIKLPGVGRKTANVVLSCAFNQATIPVDTHMIRVSGRLGLTKNTNPNKIELDLLEIIPNKWLYKAHNWIVLHGRYICKAKPLCGNCMISKYCSFYNIGNMIWK